MIVARNRRNTTREPDTVGDAVVPHLHDLDVAKLGIEPLNARSVILSSLLGSHPPRQSARSLVALAERFAIRPGTARTALSRMAAAGELEVEDARYRLAGRLLERQREQDTGLTVEQRPWDGSWWSVVVESDRRDVRDRRAFRTAMEGARMAELRPDIWLRPANTPAPPRTADVLVMRGSLDVDDVDDLVRRLWDLDEIEAGARRLEFALRAAHHAVDGDEGDEVLPITFTVAAAAVRFLRVEPQLPIELTPSPWTASTIRPLYADFLGAFQRQLRVFFAGVD